MRLNEVLSILLNPGNANIKPGIERMSKIMQLLDNPQYQYKVIHITGTNGKGSTATFIESALIKEGFVVGKYTSPFIKDINEAITLNNQPISDKDLIDSFIVINSHNKKHNINLSPFEFLTAIMFYYLAKKQIDYLVLEVGMGGTNDATNVVKPLVSVITNISLEHTNYLGDTLELIANEKAGIIKNNYTVIADNSPELINAVSRATENYVNVLDKYQYTVELDFNNFKTKLQCQDQTYYLNMLGKFQALNFLCAHEVLTYLGVSQNAINYSAAYAKIRGRLEVISHNPLIIVDAAHNEACSIKLTESLIGVFNPEDVVIITAILKDKNISAMLNQFTKLSNAIVYTNISNNPRSLDASELAKFGVDKFKEQNVCDNITDAIQFAKTTGKKMILIVGSIYLLASIL